MVYLAIESRDDVISNSVCVGIEKAVDIVDDCTAVVTNGER